MNNATTARPCTACGAVSEVELGQIDQAARRRGITRSQFVRSACVLVAGLTARPKIERRVRKVVAQIRADGDGDDQDDEKDAT